MADQTTPVPQTFHSSPVTLEQLHSAKAAYTTRRADKTVIKNLLSGNLRPRPGDLVLAQVEKLGHHKKIELQHGRRAPLFEGDEIIVCYGHRYAPDQFEAEVPNDLAECHLVAAGGVASRCISRHNETKAATLIRPLGLLADSNNQVVNIADWAVECREAAIPRPLVIGVVGTSMNAGKSTSAAYLIKGLTRAGIKVGAAKLTGTGAGGDRWLMTDAGAHEVVDFTDAGYASTYKSTLQELEEIHSTLIRHLAYGGAETIVLEIADGLFQQETAALLNSDRFKHQLDAVLFAAGDAMGACGGVAWLHQRNIPVVAISGCLSSSPLAAREAEKMTGLPVLGLTDLASANVSSQFLEQYENDTSSKVAAS